MDNFDAADKDRHAKRLDAATADREAATAAYEAAARTLRDTLGVPPPADPQGAKEWAERVAVDTARAQQAASELAWCVWRVAGAADALKHHSFTTGRCP